MKTRKLGRTLELLSMIMILVGFIAMIQPVTIFFYTVGFSVILGGVILFNIASHI